MQRSSVNHYRNRFKDTSGIRVIDLPDTTTSPPGDDEIAMTNLEYFSEVFEELSKEDWIISIRDRLLYRVSLLMTISLLKVLVIHQRDIL